MSKISILFMVLAAWASHDISAEVGRVSDKVVTSREVLICNMIEGALYQTTAKKLMPAPTISLDKIHNREFTRETTSVLLELAIFLESESFGQNLDGEDKEILNQIELAKMRLKNNKLWQKLEVSEHELETFVQRKIKAKRFLRFKMNSASIPISDNEAREYFNNNRLKFENRLFDEFRETIKDYLTKQQKDRRLKDWFELLQSKYQVRNILVK